MQHSEITKLYKGVIEEVIKNVRNDFVNMGVDEQVLYDLQMLWEQKLMDYKVISPAEYFGNGNVMLPGTIPMINGGGGIMLGNPHNVHEGALNILANGAVAAATNSSQAAAGYPYSQPSDSYGGFMRSNNTNATNNNRTTYYHPSQGYFEAPTAANLPNYNNNNNPNGKPNSNTTGNNIANIINQPTVDGGVGAIKPTATTTPANQQKQNPRRFDGAGDIEGEEGTNPQADEIIKLLYNNGEEEVILESTGTTILTNTAADNNDTIRDEDEINSDLDDDDDEDDKDVDAEGYDESGTMDENVVLCQYEKVNRTRNKWRCVFKSGIIHVNGQDYVFSKANGEFEW